MTKYYLYHYQETNKCEQIMSVVQWFRGFTEQARTESADLHDLDRSRPCLLHSVRAFAATGMRSNVHSVTSQCDFNDSNEF